MKLSGSHLRLGTSDRESRTTGVIRAYDTVNRVLKVHKGVDIELSSIDTYLYLQNNEVS